MLSCLSLFCLKLLEPLSLLLLVAKFSPSSLFRLKISKSLLSSPWEKVDVSVYLGMWVTRSIPKSVCMLMKGHSYTHSPLSHSEALWREIAVRLEDTMESNIRLIFRMHKFIIVYQFIL